jgi:hypothetical protein
MNMNDEMGMMWKTYFKLLSQHFSGWTEENHKTISQDS